MSHHTRKEEPLVWWLPPGPRYFNPTLTLSSSSLGYCGERGNPGASGTLKADSRLVQEFDLVPVSSWLLDQLVGFLC